MKINVDIIIGVTCEVLAILVTVAQGFLLTLKRLLAPSPPKSLKNEVILVTGGSSGIGQSILEIIALVESNVTLISWDIDSASNEATIQHLQSLGVKRAAAMTVDVKNKTQVSAAAEKVRREYGNVTMLFNNAGITGPLGRCWETDLDHQELPMQVNFMSHLYTLREFLPWMVENNRGHVIATCSMASFCYMNNIAPYMASKHAILGYYNCLKEDLRVASSNVRVSVVYPGYINTNMTAPYDSHAKSLTLPILTKATSASSAGQQIVYGVVRNKENIYVPWSTGLVHIFSGMFSSEVYSSILDLVGLSRLDFEKGRNKIHGRQRDVVVTNQD